MVTASAEHVRKPVILCREREEFRQWPWPGPTACWPEH
jgi:hypothetical protein